MSIHVPVFQPFYSFFASFCNGKIGHQQHKGYTGRDILTDQQDKMDLVYTVNPVNLFMFLICLY